MCTELCIFQGRIRHNLLELTQGRIRQLVHKKHEGTYMHNTYRDHRQPRLSLSPWCYRSTRGSETIATGRGGKKFHHNMNVMPLYIWYCGNFRQGPNLSHGQLSSMMGWRKTYVTLADLSTKHWAPPFVGNLFDRTLGFPGEGHYAKTSVLPTILTITANSGSSLLMFLYAARPSERALFAQ